MTVRVKPDVTCVVPTFENLHLAARAILSCVCQSGPSVEVIVSDDSRTSEVGEFVGLLSSRYPFLRYMQGPRSGNPVQNWNLGLAMAQGRFCVLVHHDEFFVGSDSLARTVSALDKCGGQWAVLPTRVIGVEGKSRYEQVQAWAPALRRAPWSLLALNWLGPTAAVTFRREGAPVFDEGLKNLVDVDFYLKLSQLAPALYVPGAVGVGSVGRHRAQISADADITERTKVEFPRLLKFYREGLPFGAEQVLRAVRSVRGS